MYAKELTRDYIQNVLRIFYVSWDGTTILKKNKKGTRIIKLPLVLNGGYYKVQVYDSEKRKAINKDERKTTDGQYFIPVQRLVYAWYFDVVPEGMLVDHIDNNKLNNWLSNLQLLTPSENLCKNTDKNTKLIKCNLNLPREWYLNKIEYYEKEYELAKKNSDRKGAHKCRSMLAWYRGKLRYYDKYIGE